MKNIVKILAVAAVAVALTQTVQAVQITGNIGFSGSAVLNANTEAAATGVVANGWQNVVTGSADSGAFSSIGANVPVTLLSPWSFNSGPLASFWTVGGFTFNLTSSSVFSSAGGFLNVVLAGTVSGNGFTTTAFAGTFQVADPSTDGKSTFTARLSFNPVPDGATTVLLLGATLSGLAFAKRKLLA